MNTTIVNLTLFLANITPPTVELQKLFYEQTVKNICNGFFSGEIIITSVIIISRIAVLVARKFPDHKASSYIDRYASIIFEDMSFLFAAWLLLIILYG